ncbi:MAG: hypothetical protein RR015_05835 [Bacteroidales bacterium]
MDTRRQKHVHNIITGNRSRLSRKDAGAARKFVKDYSGSSEAFSKNSQIYDNFVEIEGDESKCQAMVNEVTKDDGSGRPFANNSRESGGYINSDGVQMEGLGHVRKPGSDRASISMYKNRSSFHSHPSIATSSGSHIISSLHHKKTLIIWVIKPPMYLVAIKIRYIFTMEQPYRVLSLCIILLNLKKNNYL